MASIKDVAKRAGVGIGTVSRVLNGEKGVKAETRENVLDAIRTLDYKRNSLAVSFRKTKTRSRRCSFLSSIIRSFQSSPIILRTSWIRTGIPC